MITVRLAGGLGNQLFQYAFGRALSLRSGARLVFDVSRLNNPAPGDTRRVYSLAQFMIDADIVCRIPMPYRLYRWIAKADRMLLDAGYNRFGTTCFKEKAFYYDPVSERLPAKIILEGNWQSERYFSRFASVIHNEIRLREKPGDVFIKMSSFMAERKAVALHVRRGDYITNKAAACFHGICPASYYMEAVALLDRKYGQLPLVVFSDDPEWCMAELDVGRQFTLAADLGIVNDVEELLLMSICSHQIIANSSFSWWGAWLNRNPDKTVIAPSLWFHDSSVDTRDLLPENWIRLP